MCAVGSGLFFNMSSITLEAHLPPQLLAPCLYMPWAITRALGSAAGGYALDFVPPRMLLSSGLAFAGVATSVLSVRTLTPTHAVIFGTLHGIGNGSKCDGAVNQPSIWSLRPLPGGGEEGFIAMYH